MKFSRYILALSALGSAIAAPTSNSSTVDRSNLTIALIRTPPPNWPLPLTNYDYTDITFNISECVDVGIELIKEAKASGSDVVVFPELWFPGFPKGSDSHYNFTRDYLPSYIENAIVIGDAQWNRLIAAIQAVGIYANLNFAEVDGDYMHMYPSMTFNMYVQRENVHFAPFPYLAGVGDETSLWWENEWVNTGTLSVYSVLSGAYSFVAAIGATFVIDPFGSRVAHVNANASFEEFPMLYYNLNTSGFNSSQTYDINGQASWGTLSQIVDSFPGYVPKVEGEFVKQKNVSIDYLMTGELVIPS
ncbi:uncharacterized protein CCOS01_15008 [Colletotrichum costaricense]|uniref:CN hydrolase domain-containing protein n=1 Tax=Colletotrichum costaricense TaxID=1209916 RepID=A0AAI9YI78_9PEZI|nr:uncharacterized protein CCOS01_15008 [Colletotrichum costaricense]KAK1511246.1 hypothetical protein CCOS01_15008 [Colletotrichum costaricense]